MPPLTDSSRPSAQLPTTPRTESRGTRTGRSSKHGLYRPLGNATSRVSPACRMRPPPEGPTMLEPVSGHFGGNGKGIGMVVLPRTTPVCPMPSTHLREQKAVTGHDAIGDLVQKVESHVFHEAAGPPKGAGTASFIGRVENAREEHSPVKGMVSDVRLQVRQRREVVHEEVFTSRKVRLLNSGEFLDKPGPQVQRVPESPR